MNALANHSICFIPAPSTSLIVRSLTLMLMAFTLSACGATAFPGRVEAPPLWVDVNLDTWVSEIDLSYQGRVIYGRGAVSNYTSIKDRRADAEQAAIVDARLRFIAHHGRVIGRRDADAVLARLSWVEVATPIEKFFDPISNTQHVLVGITQLRLSNALESSLKNANDQTSQAERDLIVETLRNIDELFDVNVSSR